MKITLGWKTLFSLLWVLLVISASDAQAQVFSPDRLNASISASSSDASFLVAGMAAPAASAQQSAGSRSRHEGFGIGAEFGPLFSSFDQANSNFKSNNGFEGGIFFGGNRAGSVGVMGKLLYAKKGTSSVDLNYLEIPVLMRINVGSSSLNGVSVYGIVGPVADILLQGKQDGRDVKSNYESLDVGLQFGAGIEVTRFIVEGVYTKGLLNVLKSTGGTATDIKTHSFAVLFGLRFN